MVTKLRAVLGARRRRVAVAVVVLVMAVPATAFANGDLFQDISGNPFAVYINALGGAGITTGCTGGTAPNGNFCPEDSITRQAEAAFLNRAMPRVAVSTSTPLSTTVNSSTWSAVASVTITVPGVTNYLATAQQFVEVSGHFNLYDDFTAAGCPCLVFAYIDDGSTGGQNTTAIVPAAGYLDAGSGEVTAVFAASPGAHTYTMWAATDSATLTIDSDPEWLPTLIATTYPFGDTGGNTITPQAPTKAPAKPDRPLPTH